MSCIQGGDNSISTSILASYTVFTDCTLPADVSSCQHRFTVYFTMASLKLYLWCLESLTLPITRPRRLRCYPHVYESQTVRLPGNAPPIELAFILRTIRWDGYAFVVFSKLILDDIVHSGKSKVGGQWNIVIQELKTCTYSALICIAYNTKMVCTFSTVFSELSTSNRYYKRTRNCYMDHTIFRSRSTVST